VRYSKGHRERTRERILEAAGRLFRESGYDGVGVDQIMHDVGLTAGGFYSHFRSKEALFAEAMSAALEASRATPDSAAASDSLQPLIKGYLSRKHRDSVAEGCPLPVLTPDVARQSNATRERYEKQLLKFASRIEAMLTEDGGDQAQTREEALALIAECVGGLMLARAVSDEKLSDQILRSCRRGASKLCDR
jgi:TetR/AcrR family transcriptional repressor of nem operon